MRLQAWLRRGGNTPIADGKDVNCVSTGPAGACWAFGVNDDILIACDDSLKAPSRSSPPRGSMRRGRASRSRSRGSQPLLATMYHA